MNDKLIKKLEELGKINKFLGNRFKQQAYERAANKIILYNKKITSGEQVDHLPGIGKGIVSKINRILKGDPIIEYYSKKGVQAYLELNKIQGLGIAKIKELVKMGIGNFKDLKKADNIKLTKMQKIGIKHYNDLQKKIPRKESKKFLSIIKRIISGTNAKVELLGSFRRNKKMSGDLDLLISINNNSKKKAEKLLVALVQALKDKGIIIDSFIDKFTSKFMGVVKVPGYKTARHLDIRVALKNEYPFMLLYFTGSKVNNILLRAHAKTKGYKLSEYALETKNGKKIKVNSEKEIFKKLGLKYIPPSKR